MYSLGNNLSISLTGKSHDDHVGCILLGIPAGLPVSEEEIAKEMDLRRPKDGIGTQRKEDDVVEFVTGIDKDGLTDGEPIKIIIKNTNVDSSKYAELEKIPRPGHADLPAMMKWREHDARGGGQFSGRLTAPIVAAGSIAKQWLQYRSIRVDAFVRSIGSVSDNEPRDAEDALGSREYATRACDAELDEKMRAEIINASKEGDSVGGIVECIVSGLPIGFGGIWFDSLDAFLSKAIFGIPAVKGIEFGAGFELTKMKGSESNDQYCFDKCIRVLSNNMGGILGGMSNGMPLVFRTAFKPTPSISKEQKSVDLGTMKTTTISIKGRHDPCIVPRAVAVVEAVTALVIADVSLDEKPKRRPLAALRELIEQIDLRLVELMAGRNNAAKLIGEVKKEGGIQLRNMNLEKAVVQRYRAAAEGTELPPDVAEAICKLLITSSVEIQAPLLRNECKKNVTIVGGAGKMGQWMKRYFESMNASVNIVDVSVGNIKDAKSSDIVVIAVPIQAVGGVLIDIDKICKKNALIFDIASIKSPFSETIKELAKRRKVCSVHPMFGPSAAAMTNRNVIICDCGNEAAVKEAKEIFDNDSCNLTVTSVEKHDELMAFAMSLAHASNIAFFTALRESGIPYDEIKNASSTTFNRTMDVSLSVAKEDPALYHRIQRLNANAEYMWDVYEKAVKEVKEASLSDDGGKFADIMEKGKNFLK